MNRAAHRTAVEHTLSRHPGVERAAVFARNEGLLALVVPSDSYLDKDLDRSSTASSAIRKWQKTYDLNQSSRAASSAPRGFNTIGWDSSYTRAPLPDEDMHEWVRTSVESILRLGARSIYEIGCGTGMLLMRIAPRCRRYVAIDFSHQVLCRVREQLQASPDVAARVELMERAADNFDNLEPRSFDAVVINSAIQYFPHAAYLAQVLAGAVELVRDGGQVFVGDVRSLPLLSTFAASVELFQAEDDLPVGELRHRVRRRLRHGPELVLSPAWFFALRDRVSRISHVEIDLRRGRADNEMTRYRYNAVLHVGSAVPRRCAAFLEPATAEGLAQAIEQVRQGREVACIGGLPNGRIERDLRALDLIRTADSSRTAESLRREIEQVVAQGIHPQDLFDLEASHPGLRVRLSWAAARSDGSFDALLISAANESEVPCALPEPRPADSVCLANAPGQAALRSLFVEILHSHCRDHLPQTHWPDRLVLVDQIPTLHQQDADLLEIDPVSEAL